MLADLLVHTVTVHHRSGATDRFGQAPVNPRAPGATTTTSTYPGRLTGARGGLVMQERAVDTFEERFTLYLPLDVEVTTADAITVVDPQSGITLVSRAKIAYKNITTDGSGASHYEIGIWTQSGTT